MLEEKVTQLAKTNYEATRQFPTFIDIAYKNQHGEHEYTLGFCLMFNRDLQCFFYETMELVEVEAVRRHIRIYM